MNEARAPAVPPLRARGVWLLLLGILVVAGYVRVTRLSDPSISHIEIYVPGIELPQEFSDPPSRFDVASICTGVVAGEPHPPAYYIVALYWTKLFGTGLVTIRLLSALFGIATVFLVFFLCRSTVGDRAGLIAASLLAIQGFHIHWSKTAKMYSMGCFLGIASTLCLVVLLSERKKRPVLYLLYAVTTYLGLSTVVYFWPLFVVQLLYIAMTCWDDNRAQLRLFDLQVFLFLLATPLLGIIAYQSRRESYLERNPVPGLFEFFQFGYLFERAPREQPDLHLGFVLPAVLGGALFLLCLVLAVYGVGGRSRTIPRTTSHRMANTGFIWLATSLAMCLLILVFALFAHQKDPRMTPLVVAASAIPLFVAAAGSVFHSSRAHIAERLRGLPRFERLLGRGNLLLILLAFVPIAMLSLVSLVTPLLTSRGALIYVPFLTVMVAQGIDKMRVRSAVSSLVLGIVFVAHLASCVHHEELRLLPIRDYRGLAAKIASQSEPGDVFFVYRQWALTPIFYYLHEDQYDFVDRDYLDVVSERQTEKIWVFYLKEFPIPAEIDEALEGYRRERSFEVPNIWAVRYLRIGS